MSKQLLVSKAIRDARMPDFTEVDIDSRGRIENLLAYMLRTPFPKKLPNGREFYLSPVSNTRDLFRGLGPLRDSDLK